MRNIKKKKPLLEEDPLILTNEVKEEQARFCN